MSHNSSARVSISLDDTLLAAFDEYLSRHGYATRSEAIRDLIRDRLLQEAGTDEDQEVVAVVSMVFDHHARELANRLIDKQHHHHDLTVASLHVHLGERHCLEVSVLRGKNSAVRSLADSLVSTKGVLHGEVRYTGGERTLSALSRDPE